MTTSRADVENFLAQHRLAMVGASRNPNDFSRAVLREMCQRGYDMVPVNPSTRELDGKLCFASVKEITPPVEGALLMTSPADTERVVRECAAAGIRRIWMHRGVGHGSVSPGAAEFCRQHDIRLVEGYCPLMFLPKTSWFHRAHGFVLKVSGHYPARAA